MPNYHIPGKIDLTPRKHHGYAVVLFIMGTLFPPLAVAARFGIGKDFWLNLLLTICGYIPGHGHNFYIQNIRNNKTHARTPKWAQKWGLVDTSEIKRKERRSQWATRYNERLPHSTLEGQSLEDGQEAGSSSVDLSNEDNRSRKQANGTGNGDLWRPEDEHYYNQRNASQSSGGRWRYPANFDESELTEIPKKSKKKKDKKDRWERTQEAYTLSEEQSKKKKKKTSKRRKSKSSLRDSVNSRDSTTEYPEDPEGGLYGNSARVPNDEDIPNPTSKKDPAVTSDDVFNHQF